MVEFVIDAAGYPVRITASHKYLSYCCREYLSDEEPRYSVEITPEDLVDERQRYDRERQMEGLPAHNIEEALLELTALQRKLAEMLFAHDVLVFHGSVVAVDGQAYLFTATSGTGKSTHTRFWRETFGERAVMVNDDKPFLRLTKDGVMVYGSPWNGKHELGTRICLPLKGICILERGTENVIWQISGQEAAPMLFQQSNRPVNVRNMPLYMGLVDGLSKNVDIYRMKCTLDPKAAQVAFDAMSK